MEKMTNKKSNMGNLIVATKSKIQNNKANIAIVAFLSLGMSSTIYADQVILDDLVVSGSVCAGFDCVNGESFGFDTIRLKENNLRIKFQDTSASASFPSRDWQLTANDSSNGGANKFSIDDIDGGRTPFTLEAGAPSNSLYLDDAGRLGLGTSTPVVEMHSKNGDSPTLRLEQDGSSGFTPQTWDVAGNETNFFIRDATNGSKLPFRIQPGASNNSIFVAADGDIGFETSTPDGLLDVAHSANANNHALLISPASDVGINIDNSFVPNGLFDVQVGSGQSALVVKSSGHVGVGTDDPDGLFEVYNGVSVDGGTIGSALLVTETSVSIAGDLVVGGTISSDGQELNVPDYVFEESYPLMSLDELSSFVQREKHLPKVPSAKDIQRDGLEHARFQMRLLEKVEELTLYTLEQHRTIGNLASQNRALQERLERIEESMGKRSATK
jgi:hypothetical protein